MKGAIVFLAFAALVACGSPPAPLPPRTPAPEVKLDGETRLAVEAGVQLARVYIEWPTPKFFAPGDGELDLAARALAEGKTSRLYKRLVYDARIAQSVSAYQSSGMLGSTFSIVATAHKGPNCADQNECGGGNAGPTPVAGNSSLAGRR